MPHPLVRQLRFTRSEFTRALAGVTDADARERLLPMNCYGAPASTPRLDDAWAAWKTITQAADPWLDTLTTDMLQKQVTVPNRPKPFVIGSVLLRLGHKDLPEFVGNIDEEAPYRPE